MERGQASLEYVGVVAVVAVAVAVAAALAGVPDLATPVAAQVRRALCVVAGGDCLGAGGPRACVVRAHERRRDARAEALLLRLSDGRSVLREVRSDGTVQVTVVQSDGAGAAVVLGGGFEVDGVGLEASGEAGGGLRAGVARVFVRPDEAAADRLIAELAERDAKVGGVAVELARLALGGTQGGGPVPDQRRFALGAEVTGEAALRALGLTARADGLGAATVAVGVDRRTGERELVLRLASAVTARLTAPLVRAGVGLPTDATATLTFDRADRPVRLVIAHTRAVQGELRVGEHRSQGGDRAEAEVRLDLDDPAARDDVVDALAGRPLAMARTARRLAEAGRVDVRVYATRQRESGWSAGSGVLAGLGAEVVRSVERSRLVLAVGHEPGLGWSRNLECELAAGVDA